jgi:hypothetical protein
MPGPARGRYVVGVGTGPAASDSDGHRCGRAAPPRTPRGSEGWCRGRSPGSRVPARRASPSRARPVARETQARRSQLRGQPRLPERAPAPPPRSLFIPARERETSTLRVVRPAAALVKMRRSRSVRHAYGLCMKCACVVHRPRRASAGNRGPGEPAAKGVATSEQCRARLGSFGTGAERTAPPAGWPPPRRAAGRSIYFKELA